MTVIVEQKSWFARNWGWALPLGGCLTLIVLFFAFIGYAIFGVTEFFSDSTPFEDAIEKVNEDDYIVSILGDPIESEGIMGGGISYRNNNGLVDTSTDIFGPNGTATLYIVGTKKQDTWHYEELYVIITDTNEQIDLLGFEQKVEDEFETF